jgi:hypothetical protein
MPLDKLVHKGYSLRHIAAHTIWVAWAQRSNFGKFWVAPHNLQQWGSQLKYPQCSCICVYVKWYCHFVQLRYVWVPYYFCTWSMLIGQFHRRCFAINHGCSALCLHQRRSTFSVRVFAVGRCIKGCSHERLSAQHENSVLPQWSVYEWNEKLETGRKSVMHEEGARSPSTTTNEDNNNHACDTGLLDRWMTTDEVANRLQISHASAYLIIHNRLGYHKVSAK